MTSRWLVAAAQVRDVDIRWRTFSLELLNNDRPLPAFLDTPEFKAKQALAGRALRVVQVAVSAGDNDAAARFYAEWGTQFHVAGREPTAELLDEIAATAGVTELLARVDDPGVEPAMAESLAEAVGLAGPDVGSPVLHIHDVGRHIHDVGRHIDGADRGLFGPIVSPAPTGEEAALLWDAVVALQGMTTFYELKRGRPGPPDFGPA